MATSIAPPDAPRRLAAREPRLGGELGAFALMRLREGAVSPPGLAAHAGVDAWTARSALHRLAVAGLARAAVIDGLTWFAITPEGDALIDRS